MTDATKKTTVAMLKSMSSIGFQTPSVASIYPIVLNLHILHRVEKRFIGVSSAVFDEAP
jgi:hypothetical protein